MFIKFQWIFAELNKNETSNVDWTYLICGNIADLLVKNLLQGESHNILGL